MAADLLGLGILSTALAGMMMASSEVGFRVGRRARAHVHEALRAQMTTLQGAVLGLLALLLGFAFALGSSRFELRKQLVVDEANAIGTSSLRARILPAPVDAEVGALLRSYVDVRLAFYGAAEDDAAMRRTLDETERLQEGIWSRVAAVARRDPHSIMTGLLLQSLNEMIDLNSKRVAAMRNHIPHAVLATLCVVATASLGWVGLCFGLGGKRSVAVTLVLSLLVAFVVAVIVDLDQPRRGLVRISQQPMTDLQRSLRAAP